MKYLFEYRDADVTLRLAQRIRQRVSRPWRIMEICGGQTHSILRHGLLQLLPEELELVHGPGCPVCVTPAHWIDAAIEMSLTPGVVLCSFGDMLRVPGSGRSLLQARAEGARVELVSSPLDVVRRASERGREQFVFFAVGFETTAPATALALRAARQRGLENFCVLSAHVAVPPALTTMLSAPDAGLDGLLAAGHVCTVMGLDAYRKIAQRFALPVVATGFEPVDLLHGILQVVEQLEAGRCEVLNAYDRAVAERGNPAARAAVEEVFRARTFAWRGIGAIEEGGLAIRSEYAELDAERRFFDPTALLPSESPPPGARAPIAALRAESPPASSSAAEAALRAERHSLPPSYSEPACIAGEVLLGKKRPQQCEAFGTRCTPEHPLGAPMVSSEGACAAYYRHGARARLSRIDVPHGRSASGEVVS